MAKFLYKNIINRFSCPKELVGDPSTHFLNSTIEQLLQKYMIKHWKSTSYYPQANGQIEKTNGIMYKIITKIIQGLATNCDQWVFDALWAYRTTFKVTTKHTPFQLLFGQDAILPIELKIPSLRIAVDNRLGDLESLEHRYDLFEKLDEVRGQAYLNTVAIQNQRKSFYDSKSTPKD